MRLSQHSNESSAAQVECAAQHLSALAYRPRVRATLPLKSYISLDAALLRGSSDAEVTMDKAGKEKALLNPAEVAGDGENVLPPLGEPTQQRTRLIQECHAIARDDASKEGESFFGVPVLK